MSEELLRIPPGDWLPDRPTANDVARIRQFLERQGTFHFPTVESGLFSAAANENPEFRLTGYQNVWARDNCHIAHALWRLGETVQARRAVEALLTFYERSRPRFLKALSGQADLSDPQQRPHIRFDGDTLEELDVHWSHAQNDALGAVLWLSAAMARSGDLDLGAERWETLRLLAAYFEKVRFWQDEDSGHWEEKRKIEASSIGVVVAGLKEFQILLSEQPHTLKQLPPLADLIARGEEALEEILPAECIQPDPLQNRKYDSALLFLIFPFRVASGAIADRIVTDVREHLLGPIGIRRYLGDSYWCANYRDLLPAETRTTDVSDDMSARDKLLIPGQEAQWCLFDPILSIIHGERFLATGREDEADQQVWHLRRSLKQLTTSESRFAAYRCPESYFLEHGAWIPNDITPLLWTQANLRLALQAMEQTALTRTS